MKWFIKQILEHMHTLCIALSLLFLVFICVNQELFPGFIPCPKGEAINGVVSIIGGSFIAGYIFYLMTYTIPNNKKNKETNNLLNNHFHSLQAWVDDVCIEPFNIIRRTIKDKNENDVFYPKDQEYKEIHYQMNRIQFEVRPIISDAIQPIFKYFPSLTPEQQGLVEKINEPSFYYWLDYFQRKQALYVSEVQVMLEHYDILKDDIKSLLDTIKSQH